MVVDYSRFDAIDVSDSDSDGGGGNALRSRQPVVTRLSAPSRVTFGGPGSGASPSSSPPEIRIASDSEHNQAGTSHASASTDYARFERMAREMADEDDEGGEDSDDETDERLDEERRRQNDAKTASPPTLPQAAPTSARAFTAPQHSVDSLTRDGACVAPTHYWSQARDDVVISIAVPGTTRAKDVLLHVARGEPGQPPSLGVGTRRADHETTWHKRGALARRVVLDEGSTALSAEDLDWSLADVADGGAEGFPPEHRVVRVWLRKEHPGGGIAVSWWSSAFADDSIEIDTTKISARQPQRAEQARATMEVWRAAEAEFAQRVESSALPEAASNK